VKLRHHAAALIILAALFGSPIVRAQGCAQCRDNTAATPPATQRAYRHAIALLALTASGLFVVTLAIFKRSR
jgi:hypothetical protein